MKKQILSLLLCVVLVVGLAPTSVFATSTSDTWAVTLGVAESSAYKYNGENVLSLGFGVQSDTLKLKTAQSIVLAIDLEVFDFLQYSSDEPYPPVVYEPQTETLTTNGSAITTGEKVNPSANWSVQVNCSKSSSGKTGYMQIIASQSTADYAVTSKKDIATTYIGFKSGKSLSDVTVKSIRFVDGAELSTLNQASAVEITDGDKNKQNAIMKDGSAGTLKIAPTIDWGTITPAKETPAYIVPTNLSATYGDTLEGVALPKADNGTWSWADKSQSVGDVGTRTFKATFTPTDTVTYKTVENIDVQVTVSAKKIDDVAIANIADQEYTGSKIEPQITVTGDSGKTLVKDTDYTITYGGNTTVGNNSGTVTVQAKTDGNYTFNEVTKNFNIVAKAGQISISGSLDKTYDGNAVTTTGITENKQGSTGAVTYTFYTNADCTTQTTAANGATADGGAPENAGDYWVKATMAADTNYGSATSNALKFTISKANITPSVTITGWTYDGTAATPNVTGNTGTGDVAYAYKVKDAADNTYETEVPTDAGTYTVRATVAETTNYNGATATADFTIAPKSISGATIADITAVTYSGNAHTPTPTVTNDTKELTSGTDFTYSYSDNTNAGTATVTITGKGNYTGTASKTFTINKASLTYSVDTTKNIKVGSALSAFTSIAPTTAEGIEDESVSGTVKWYSDQDRKTDAKDSDVNTLEVRTTKVLYWTFTPGSTNYDTAQGSVTFTIVEGDPQNISFEQTAVTKTYGDAKFTNKASNKTNDGKAITDGGTITWTSSDTSVATVDETGLVTILKVGSTEITATAAAVPGKYAQGTEKYTLTVKAKSVTITGLAAMDKVYDGSTTATVNGTAVINGVLEADKANVEVATGTATFADKKAGADKTVTFSGYSLSGTAAANYVLSDQPASVKADITQKEVSITAVTATTRGYNGSKDVALTGATLSGVVTSDNVSVTGGKGTIESADAGEGKNVTVTGYVLTGNDAANYKLTAQPTNITVTISKANAVTIADQSVSVKNTNANSQTISLAKLMPKDAGTLTYTAVTKTDNDNIISDWSVTDGVVTFTLSESMAVDKTATLPVTIGSTNYSDSTANVVVTTVSKDVPELTVSDISKVYDGKALENSAIKGTAKFGETNIEGTWAFKDGSALTNVADSGAKTVVFTPTNGDNYATVEKAIIVTINKAKPTGTPAYEKITTSGKTLANANLAIGTIKPDATTYTIAWDLPTDTAVVQGTAYAWTFTPADAANYETLTGEITLWAKSSTSGGGGGGGYVAPTTTETTAKTFIASNLTAGGKVYASATADNYKAILAAKDAYGKLSASEQAALDKELKAQTGKTLAELVAEAEAVKAEVEKEAEDAAVTKAEVKATKFKVKSKAVTLNGKKAIKISWYVTDGDLEKGDFDGFAIYRSTKKNAGYGKSAYYNTTKTTYTNNKGLKAGKTYYYKIRAYKYIDGVKTFTGYSTKAWRTMK